MSWQILVALNILLYGISVILQKRILKDDKSDPVSFSIIFQVGVAIVIGILVLLIQGSIPLPSIESISWSLLAMTLLYALANILIFKSLKETEASRFTVIFSSKTLFAVIGTSIVFKQLLSPIQWLGALLIIAGVVVVSFKKVNKKLNKGDLWALAAAFVFGLANINDTFLVKFFDPYSYVVIGFLLPGIAISILNPKKIAGVKIYIKKSMILKLVLLCLVYGLSAVSFFAALQIAENSSQLFSVSAFSSIVTVILSIIFLKETGGLFKKLIGAIVSVTGLILVNS